MATQRTGKLGIRENVPRGIQGHVFANRIGANVNYTNITNMADRPPEGWEPKLSPNEYEALEADRKNYYSPVYAKYHTKKYRDYDDHDNYIGWASMEVGVGKPIGYKYHGVIMARVIDSVLNSSVIATRLLSKR